MNNFLEYSSIDVVLFIQESICYKCSYHFHRTHDHKEVLLNNEGPKEAEPKKKSIGQLSSNGSSMSEDAGKQMEKVKVLYVETPARIFVRDVELEDKYLQMREVLWKITVSSDNSSPGEIRVSSWVICYLAASASWERGLVMALDTHQGHIQVRLADIGEMVVVAKSEVRLAGQELENFGTLTQCVALTDLEPAGTAGNNWSKESAFVLRELLHQKIVLMRRVGGGGAVHLHYEKITVEGPLDPLRKSLISVAKVLIKKGLAYKTGTREICFNIGGSERDPSSVAETAVEPELKMITGQSDTNGGVPSLPSKDEVGEVEGVEGVPEPEGESEEEEEEDSSSDSDSASYLGSSLSPPSSPTPSQMQRMPAEPEVPSSSLFTAKLTTIDSKGTVWVVPKDTSKIEEEVRRLIKVSTESCPRYEGRVGEVVVMRKNKCRGRIIHHDFQDQVTLLDLDSGKKHTVDWSLLSLPASSLLDFPPLAIPLKLYGVKKSLAELSDLQDVHYDEVTVLNLALNKQRFPLPANIRFANNKKNLALDLLEKGSFQLIKNQADWTKEFLDHGLDKELDPREKYMKESDGKSNYWSIVSEGVKQVELLNMNSLAHPLPLTVGQWLGVQVEAIVSSVEAGPAGQVCCSLWPTTAPGPEGDQEEVAASASIINAGLETLQIEFEEFEEELMFKMISADLLAEVSIGQQVLALYQTEEDKAWSRAVIENIKEDGGLVVTYSDYGYRGDVTRDNVRAITKEQWMEPRHVRDLQFKLPEGKELQEIRSAMWDATMARVEEIKFSEEGEKVQVSFWRKDGLLKSVESW